MCADSCDSGLSVPFSQRAADTLTPEQAELTAPCREGTDIVDKH